VKAFVPVRIRLVTPKLWAISDEPLSLGYRSPF
jgi:hypothetical protein